MKERKIAVIGLGYVGLPLAVSLSKHFPVVGYDCDSHRIQELGKGFDRTGEISKDLLEKSSLKTTSMIQGIAPCDLYIVTVPTPIDQNNEPDLACLQSACQDLGPLLKKGDVIVFESTVYPGVTEEFCGPILEKASQLTAGKDFFLGYSPERINPGDKKHTVETIIKVVAGQSPEITQLLTTVYGRLNNNQIHVAPSIKVAEASKVIENAQRDINIAFMNEISLIFQKLHLSVYDVLEAAETKWNFLPFRPGFVGGHCIGVDPFYLASCAKKVDLSPDVILSGRKINDTMPMALAENVSKFYEETTGKSKGTFLVLGLTFKENIPDLRNSKVIPFMTTLKGKGFSIDVADPHAHAKEARGLYNLELKDLSSLEPGFYDGIIMAVAHDDYAAYTWRDLAPYLKQGGCLFDMKGAWRHWAPSAPAPYWCL